MRKGRRRRRASLRGWWRALPFIALGGVTFFVFAWLHTQRLRNEYHAIELTAEIRHTKDRIAELRGKGYQLGSMERMEDVAPQHALVEARPGQIQVIRPTEADLIAFEAASQPPAAPARPTRSVIVLLEAPAAGGAEATPDSAMAQVGPAQNAGPPETL
jgi:hypothetical protein